MDRVSEFTKIAMDLEKNAGKMDAVVAALKKHRGALAYGGSGAAVGAGAGAAAGGKGKRGRGAAAGGALGALAGVGGRRGVMELMKRRASKPGMVHVPGGGKSGQSTRSTIKPKGRGFMSRLFG